MIESLKSLNTPDSRDCLRKWFHRFLVIVLYLGALGWLGQNWYAGYKADAYAQRILLKELEKDIFVPYNPTKFPAPENGVVIEMAFPQLMGIVSYDRPSLYGDTQRVSVTITLYNNRIRKYYTGNPLSRILSEIY